MNFSAATSASGFKADEPEFVIEPDQVFAGVFVGSAPGVGVEVGLDPHPARQDTKSAITSTRLRIFFIIFLLLNFSFDIKI